MSEFGSTLVTILSIISIVIVLISLIMMAIGINTDNDTLVEIFAWIGLLVFFFWEMFGCIMIFKAGSEYYGALS